MTRLRLWLVRCEEWVCPTGVGGLIGVPADVPVAIADLNGDGTPDVVAGDPAANEVRVWLRAPGTGAFTQSFQTTTGAHPPSAVAAADLDADGVPDLLVATAGGVVRVYAGRPGGTFDPEGEYPVGDGPAGLLVADVNGDAVPDLLTADEASNDVRVLLGTRTAGRWAAVPAGRTPAGGPGPVALAFRDQTGDGRADLVVFTRGSQAVSVVPALGGGRFGDTPTATLALPPGGSILPALDPASGAGFVTDGAGAVLGFDLDALGRGARPLLSAGGDDPVIGLTPVSTRGGAGLILATASGRVTLVGQTADGTYSVRQTAGVTGGRFAAAVADRRGGTGFDVYLVPRGAGRPVVVTLDDVPSVGVGPTDGPSVLPLAAVRLSFDVGPAANGLAPVPAVGPRPAAPAPVDAREVQSATPLEPVAAWNTPFGSTDPESNEVEAVTGWEQWYLDVDRLLRDAVRLKAVPPPEPALKPQGTRPPDRDDAPAEGGAGTFVDPPPPGGAATSLPVEQPTPERDDGIPDYQTLAPAAFVLLWGVGPEPDPRVRRRNRSAAGTG